MRLPVQSRVGLARGTGSVPTRPEAGGVAARGACRLLRGRSGHRRCPSRLPSNDRFGSISDVTVGGRSIGLVRKCLLTCRCCSPERNNTQPERDTPCRVYSTLMSFSSILNAPDCLFEMSKPTYCTSMSLTIGTTTARPRKLAAKSFGLKRRVCHSRGATKVA